MEYETISQMRKRIRLALPDQAFKPVPLRALIYFPTLAIILGGFYLVKSVELAVYVKIIIGLVIAFCYSVNAFLGHEMLHGSVIRNKWMQRTLGTLSFFPFLIPPFLWQYWHNYAHHKHANFGANCDPDCFGKVEELYQFPLSKSIMKALPRWVVFGLLFVWVSIEAQIILWIRSRYDQIFKGYKPGRDKVIVLASLTMWILIINFMGLSNSLYVVFLPCLLANAIVMSYIMTNHFIRPLSDIEDPLGTTMSVKTLPIIDKLHLNFSHHVEHHFFPGMSGKYLPLVRDWLIKNKKNEYICPTHWKAIRYIYATPRYYLTDNTLIDISGKTDAVINLAELNHSINMHQYEAFDAQETKQ